MAQPSAKATPSAISVCRKACGSKASRSRIVETYPGNLTVSGRWRPVRPQARTRSGPCDCHHVVDADVARPGPAIAQRIVGDAERPLHREGFVRQEAPDLLRLQEFRPIVSAAGQPAEHV